MVHSTPPRSAASCSTITTTSPNSCKAKRNSPHLSSRSRISGSGTSLRLSFFASLREKKIQIMNSIYAARSHTKKQKRNSKPAISIEERKRRKQQKQIAKEFPCWKCFLPCYSANPVREPNVRKPHSPLTIHNSPS